MNILYDILTYFFNLLHDVVNQKNMSKCDTVYEYKNLQYCILDIIFMISKIQCPYIYRGNQYKLKWIIQGHMPCVQASPKNTPFEVQQNVKN